MKRTRLRPMSPKKRAEIAARKLIVRDTCALAGHSPCSGPIEKHEIVRRNHDRTAAVNDDLVIGLCAFTHHPLDLHKDTAVELGIRIDPFEWQTGDDLQRRRLLHDAEHRRAVARGDVPRDAA